MKEKRRQPRADIVLTVEISAADRTSSVHQTRNMGLGGMYVELGEGQAPEAGSDVVLTFIGGDRHRMKARVSRVADNGIALIFRDFSIDDLRFLEEAMQ